MRRDIDQREPSPRAGTSPGPPSPVGPAEGSLVRVAALSDGVFAVAMTLLVLDVHVPDLPAQHSQADLIASLLALWPVYITYVVSFLAVGEFWFGHHQTLGVMRRVDQRFMSLNLFFLLSISVVPFLTAILGRYWNERVAVQFYAAFFTVSALLDCALWVYATYRRRLVDATVEARLIAHRTVTMLVVAGIFAASIGIAVFSPQAAELSWALIWVAISLQRLRAQSLFRAT